MWGVSSGSASRTPDPRLVIRDLDAELVANEAAAPDVRYSGDARGMGSSDAPLGPAAAVAAVVAAAAVAAMVR